MSATKFIDLLEDQGLLDPEVIQELRRSFLETKNRVTAESLAKVLVENGQLTRFQATRLIGQIQSNEVSETTSTSSTTTASTTQSTDEILELVDEDSGDDDEIVEAIVVRPNDATTALPEVSVEPELASIATPVVSRDSASSTSSPIDSISTAPAYVKPVRIAAPKKDQWDAFRIWGVGFILSVLLVALGWLVYWLTSKTAGEYYAQAVEAYETSDYKVAAELFSKFAASYPTEANASKAKVLSAIANIREASDQLGDPSQAIERAEGLLPTVVNETGLTDDGVRSDLASALVSIAEKMLDRADGAKETDQRKTMMATFDRHLLLMQNPQYIPNANRLTNEARLKAIDERRARILRDIQRAEDLVIAKAAMETAISASDVNAAYQARRDVTRKYPQLETDEELLSLQLKATEIQRQLVKAATVTPKLAEVPAKPLVAPQVLLFKQNPAAGKAVGETVIDPELIIFARAKGSIYGLRAIDGSVLWRRYVGIAGASDPIRLSSDPRSDCLIVVPGSKSLSRLSGMDGTPLWQVDFDSRLLHPTVEGSTIFFATEDGRVGAIDADTGQAKWTKQLPQKLTAGVGGSMNKPGRYIVGDHSNLYVLGRNDGECKEVFYLGHTVGTVSVPPIHSLGQLFVFVNFDATTSKIFIYKTSDEGVEVAKAQDPITLKGHIKIPPSLDGRRLVVMTDLGETVAFDIEPASNKNKLNRVAGLVANESKPRVSWPLVAGNELWIASNRFARFQIQVVDGKLVRDWVIEDEDQFTGRPFKHEDLVFHARTVRGTEGIRFAATNALTGKTRWEVDLGVPVAGVHATGNGIAVVNSQAALFALNAGDFGDGKTATAVENPGRNQRTMHFAEPIELTNGRTAYLNAKQGTQVAIFDPKGKSGNSLLVNSLQLSDGTPSGTGAAIQDGLVIPINNGQLVYVDPTSGKQLVPPFQPALDVESKTNWLTPVVLSDGQTLVATTNKKVLYRLGIGKQIKELSQTDIDDVWVQRMAVIENTVCGIARGSAQDRVEIVLGTDLSKIASAEIDGRVTWGPYAADEFFIVYSETSGMAAFNERGERLWQQLLPNATPATRPLLDSGDILIGTSNGKLFRLSLSNGEIRGEVSIGEPLTSAPFVMGAGLLLPCDEGLLYALPLARTTQTSEGSN